MSSKDYTLSDLTSTNLSLFHEKVLQQMPPIFIEQDVIQIDEKTYEQMKQAKCESSCSSFDRNEPDNTSSQFSSSATTNCFRDPVTDEDIHPDQLVRVRINVSKNKTESIVRCYNFSTLYRIIRDNQHPKEPFSNIEFGPKFCEQILTDPRRYIYNKEEALFDDAHIDAKRGVSEGMYNLYNYYEHGIGCTKSMELSNHWLEKAVFYLNTDALYKMSQRLRDNIDNNESNEIDQLSSILFGSDRMKDGMKRERKMYLHIAANQNHAEATMDLYEILFKEGDLMGALIFLERAATQHKIPEAMLHLGEWYHVGRGSLQRNEKKAMSYWALGAEKGNIGCHYHFAKSMMDNTTDKLGKNKADNPEYVLYHMKVAADAKYRDADYIYGECLYRIGERTQNTSNIHDALVYVKSGADRGDYSAQDLYSTVLLEGKWVQKDAHTAFIYLDLASAAKYVPAMFRLGKLYLEGDVLNSYKLNEGIRLLRYVYHEDPHNVEYMYMYTKTLSTKQLRTAEERFRLLLTCARQNHTEAMVDLALCYIDGIGCTKNTRIGADLIHQAANLGNKKAINILRTIHS